MRTRSRRGVTPVIAIVLLLMMTVAAAGGAFAWYEQMSEQVMSRASGELATTINVKDLQCDGAVNQITLWVKNEGRQSIVLSSVDLYIRDGSGNLIGVGEDLSWGGAGFSQPGGLGKVVVDFDGPPSPPSPTEPWYEVAGVQQTTPSGWADNAPSDSDFEPGNFYDVEFDIAISGSGQTKTVNAGSCTAI